MGQRLPRYPTRFLAAFITFLMLLLIGTAGYYWLEEMSLVNALYMTVITISTVGFGEVHTLSSTGRLFTIGLIVGGGGLAAFSITTAADFFMSGEWRTFWLHRRYAQMLSTLKDHVIVCGFGRVGHHVAEELTDEGVPFVVIDNNPDRIAHAQKHHYLAMEGNAANETTLREVGIENARAMITAVGTDAENVFITLTARSLRPDIFIAARANYEDSEPKLLSAGANRTILPYQISGKRMVTTVLRPNVADFLDEVSHAGGLELLLEQINIDEGSVLDGQTLSEAQLGSRLGVTVLACRKPDGTYGTHPGPNMTLQSGTLIIVLGTRHQIQELLKLAKPDGKTGSTGTG
ncbi:MAG: NAD-binding protein [Anaerolineales bacterium]|nr:NAD-binding protein [Anaerolineales bacterium]